MKQATVKIMATLACLFMLAAGKANAQKDTIFLGEKLKEVTKSNGTALLHTGPVYKLYVTFKKSEIVKLYMVDKSGKTRVIVDYTRQGTPVSTRGRLNDIEREANKQGYSLQDNSRRIEVSR